MAVATYNELITATFRDNAIRSVMMIDDDFVPYKVLSSPGFSFDSLGTDKKAGQAKASRMHDFFQSKKIVCDIDNGVDHIEIDKIRKCDLIILDYHLENDDPKKSIQTLQSLRDTEHMNLVVVYTSEELDKVWRQIAASLVGNRQGDIEPDLENFLIEEDVDVEKWADMVSNDDITQYILTGKPTVATTKEFGREFKKWGTSVLKEMVERKLKEINLIQGVRNEKPIAGKFERWLHTGNVFVALYRKNTVNEDEEPKALWDAIESSLIDWNPSYYRLLISEMQNRLENEPLSFQTDLGQDLAGQAAWLYDILVQPDEPTRKAKINQLFERLTDELERSLVSNRELQGIIAKTFQVLSDLKHQTSDSLLKFSAEHVRFASNEEKDLKLDMGHALNATLCARAFDGEFITCGTVLKDTSSGNWYLCVAPACETIPVQLTGRLAKKLEPHRLMKVLVLENTAVETALAVATDSYHIFITMDDGRKALSVLNPKSKQPVIDYILVNNHKNSNLAILKQGIDVTFFETLDKKELAHKKVTLIPVWQLRDVYAARYQTLASNHTGRVGVDFVNFE